jgi:hypothetical protein
LPSEKAITVVRGLKCKEARCTFQRLCDEHRILEHADDDARSARSPRRPFRRVAQQHRHRLLCSKQLISNDRTDVT